MKCDVCKNTIQETFLGKIKGTHISMNGKKKVVCNTCQEKHSMEELKKTLHT